MMLADLAVKFADDTKGAKEVKTEKERDELQLVFNNLFDWSQKWGMEFNIPKCKIIHVGRHNPAYKYYIDGQELNEVEEERDIGVLVHSSLKPREGGESGGGGLAADRAQLSIQRPESVLSGYINNMCYRTWSFHRRRGRHGRDQISRNWKMYKRRR
jgi:hypothetical protein